jgi:chemotaxis protein MotB
MSEEKKDKAGGGDIFIKKIKKGAHGAHGGVWKLAYADFVTAMMAFFLLMWLLNVTSEEMKSGLAQYFSPDAMSSSSSGSGDVFFGLTVTVESPMQAQSGGVATIIPIPESVRQGDGGASGTGRGEAAQSSSEATRQGGTAESQQQGADAAPQRPEPTPPAPEPREAQAAAGASATPSPDPRGEVPAGQAAGNAREQSDARDVAALQQRLLQAMREAGLRDVTPANLSVSARPDGVLIEIMDAPGIAMFEIGSARPQEEARKFIAAVARVLRERQEQIAVFGHTDARPFPTANYTNWELAADRANAARRVLLDGGIRADRVVEVNSRADMLPRNPTDRFAPENRRIEILLVRPPQ